MSHLIFSREGLVGGIEACDDTVNEVRVVKVGARVYNGHGKRAVSLYQIPGFVSMNGVRDPIVVGEFVVDSGKGSLIYNLRIACLDGVNEIALGGNNAADLR